MSLARGMASKQLAKMPHIAIIGAGISGLRCADVLLRSGAKVTMFEARDRVGGRVHQCKNDGHLVDMGPNWIHGTEGNPIMKLAERTGTVTVEPEERQTIFDSDGNKKSEKESVELGAEVWATIVDAFKYSNEHHPDIDPRMSLMDYFKQELPKRFPKEDRKVNELLQEASMWGFFVGEDIERQSLRCFFLEECLEGDNVIVASTYRSILSEVAKTAMQAAAVRHNEEVVQIEYRDENDEAIKPVAVTTKQGQTSSFDEVVITCPLGWLKRNTSAFTPALPPRMSEAIDNISYGRLEKLLISFPSAFWLDESFSGSSSPSSDSSFTSLANTTSSTPIFVHFHHPTYHPDPHSKNPTKNGKWNQDIVSLAHLPGSTAHPTLLFYIYGGLGTYLTSLIAPHALHSPAYNEILLNFSLPYFSRLFNFSSSNPACSPTSFLMTQWQNDPYAGYGSYSNFQIGLEHGDKDIEVMRDGGGLSKAGRGLWFAGEHVAPFVAVGTTTGAYWSGEAVGRSILERYGVDVALDEDEMELDAKVLDGDGGDRRKDLDESSMGGASLSGLAI